MKEQAEFVARHAGSDFRHKDELLALLTSDDCMAQQDLSPLPCAHLLNIYRRRAEHLRQFSTEHARQLRDDILALCDALAKTSDQHCRLWLFSTAAHSDYTVFEGAETGQILGCVVTRDKRLTAPHEWESLWFEKDTH